MPLEQFVRSIAVAALVVGLSPAAPGEQPMRLNAARTPQTPVVLFLSGDVMLGRAIDQILPYHADPVLYEDYIRDARDYIRLAEDANGPIRQPVSCEYIWGDALDELAAMHPDASIINLETSVTQRGSPWKNKFIHYRMHPENAACLKTADIDVALLANNHVLDWGYTGLKDTLSALTRAGVSSTGSGTNLQAASRPAVIDLPNKGRVIVSAWAHASSGVPSGWAATTKRPGVNRLDYLNEKAVQLVGSRIRPLKQSGDIAVASIHWGGNWGYEIPSEQIQFAHQLIDTAGVDILHGP